MLSPPPLETSAFGLIPSCLGDRRQDRSDRRVRIDQFRQRRLQAPARIDVAQQLQIPLAGAHVEIARA
jgi:hypothetical protein